MNKDVILVLRGEANWAKVIGKARPYTGNPKYDKGPYWSIDLTPDEKSLGLIKSNKIDGKLRDPGEKDSRTEPFLSLRVLEFRPDGEKNNPPKIIDASGRDWGDDLIGNGSVVDVMVKVKDYGKGVEKGVYLQKIRVLKHVSYAGGDFEPLSEEDAYFAAPESSGKADSKGSPNLDDLDDDFPA